MRGVAQDVHVPEGINEGGVSAPGDHALANEGVEGGGGSDAAWFLGGTGTFEVGFGSGLGDAQGIRGGVKGGDGGTEGNEVGLGDLAAEADAEVAQGIELFLTGASGKGFPPVGEEKHVGGAAVGDLAADGGVPIFQEAGSIGIGLASEGGHFVIEGHGGGGLCGLGIGDGGFAAVPCRGGGGKRGDHWGEGGISGGGGGGAGEGIGQYLAHQSIAAYCGGKELVFSIF